MLHKKRCIRLFFFTCAMFCMLLGKLVFCQELQPRFVPLEGSRNYDDIRAVLPDSKGFLWFGSNQGLVRFDGNSYQRFEPGYGSKTIASDAVTTLCEDSNAVIWIGTATGGLYSYHHNADTFKLHSFAAKSAAVSAIEKYNAGIVLCSGNVVFILENGRQARPVKFADSLLNNEFAVVKAVQGNSKNVLWMLTSAGLYSYDDNTAIVKKWHGHGFSVDEVGNQLATLVASPAGKIYSATKNKGLIELDIATGKTTQYVFAENVATAYTSNNIDALLMYDDQHLFAATQEKGVAVFNNRLGTFNFLQQDNFSETNFFRFHVKSFGANSRNIVMATQHDGIWVFNKASQLFHTVAVPSKYNKVQGTLYTRSIYAAPDEGKLYAGSFFGDGLYVFNAENTAVKSYPFLGNDTQGQTLIINAIFRDHAGVVWVASHQNGVLIFDKAKQMLVEAAKVYPALGRFNTQKIYCFYEDKQRNLYIASGDAGLLKVDGTRQQTTHYQHNEKDSSTILTNNLFAEKIFEDSKGRLWLSAKGGITVLDTVSQHFFHFTGQPGQYNSLPASFWYPVEQDHHGAVYIGTGNGIFKIGADEKTLRNATHFTVKNGLQHNTIFSFVKDGQGMLWVTTRSGLSCFNVATGRFFNFNYKNGLPAKTLMAPMQMAPDGNIYHGAVGKFFYFNPAELLRQQNSSDIWLTAFKVFDKDSITGLALNNFKKLQLPYHQNSFSFSFVSPSFYYPDAVNYAYMLQGFDKEWKLAGSRNFAHYTNVSPGTYLLKIKAAGANGIWGNNVRTIEIIIEPPFWHSWWLRVIVLLFALAVGYLFIKRRERQAAKKEAANTAAEKLKAESYRYQLEIEQVINFFVTSINQQNSIDEMLWDVAKNCISKLGFEDCVIYLLDNERKVLIQKAAWGPKTTEEDKIVNPIEIELGKGIVGYVAMNGKAEIIHDTSIDERYIVDDASRLSEIALPIVNGKKVIGVIDSEHSQKHFYTERHLKILTTIASLIADKIDKMKVEQQAREKEMELLRLNKDLATWQITALRAQMNPHFIFNAMNSIQQFTLQHDSDNANLYISKFSTLLRKVLYTSGQNNISLEEEMEQLKLYLDIEQLRMGKDFVYHITADEELETDALKIPAMLVQPFVENAIKHGLALKEGEKRLAIHFFMPDEFHINAIITDNGIGRERAEALKQQQKLLPHISKGISLVKERLQLLEQYKNHHAAIFINDLPGGSGTQVTVVIPVG